MRRLVTGAAFWIVGVMTGWAGAQSPKQVYLETESAGADYQVQGEYVGQMTSVDGKSKKLGAQVIALGGGLFEAVFLSGGLPGAGWDGQAGVRAKGKRKGETTCLIAVESEGGLEWTAEIVGEKLTGVTGRGESFELRKVARASPTLGAAPPEGAVVLFTGSDTEEWVGGRMDARKLLHVGTHTRRSFKDFRLHLEFRTPLMPHARGQARGNSGVYLQGLYEIQVLDSFGLQGAADECGGIYGVAPPRVNMCLPPLAWQTYDVEFTAPRYDEQGRKTRSARVTVRHNGVLVHENVELRGPTCAHQGKESPAGGPLYLQDHGNPVFCRNIWVVEK